MEKEFDQYEFENYLTDEFFSGNELSEIKKLIKIELTTMLNLQKSMNCGSKNLDMIVGRSSTMNKKQKKMLHGKIYLPKETRMMQ